MYKKDEIKNVFKLSGVFIGGVIGAGFASGKELNEFFLVYGSKWIYGLLLCGILFSLCLFGIIDISNRNKNILSYKDFMEHIMGKRLGGIMEMISGLFLCVLFFAMISASGTVGKEAFGVDFNIGVAIILLICLFIFIKGEEGIIKLNAFLAPLLVSGCIFLGINAVLNKDVQVFNLIGNSWIFSALLYTSYNIITMIPIIVPLKHLVPTARKALLCGITGGMGIFLIGVSAALSLLLAKEEVLGEIPMLYALSKYEDYILWVYKIVLIAAIFTTAAANGFGAIKWLEKKIRIGGVKLYIFILGLGAFFSRISFSGFVGVLYPFFGYIGLAEIAVIIFFVFIKGILIANKDEV